jgi:GT2 family glycosyltransferase
MHAMTGEAQGAEKATIGVAITAFRSADIIEGCLDALLASNGPSFRVAITDNASPDDTVGTIRRWAAAHADRTTFAEREAGDLSAPSTWLTLVHSPINGGFAHGTNRALEVLRADAAIDLFWVLNPDCRPDPQAAKHYATAATRGPFALMGGRTIFEAKRDLIQTDGGRVSRWTGVCHSVNWGRPAADTAMPEVTSLDYITGANCVASRAFLDAAGLMEEDYFLYYEEVDWAMRRGDLPLRIVPEALVYHIGGATIGSGVVGGRPTAFANYFNYRNRIRFLRRFNPAALPIAYVFACAKAAKLVILGGFDEARGAIAGLFFAPPPKAVRAKLTPQAGALAFGEKVLVSPPDDQTT